MFLSYKSLDKAKKANAAPVVAAIIDQQEMIRLERGSAFKAFDMYYSETKSETWGDWAHIGFVYGYCRSTIWKDINRTFDEVDFYLRLLSYVKMRGGKPHRFNQGIFVSARLPHTNEHRGSRFPGGEHSTHSVGFLPDDPRLIPALKKHGIDVRGLNLGGGRS